MLRLRNLVDSLSRTSRDGGGTSVMKSQGLSLLDAPKIDPDKMTCEAIVCTDIVDYQQEVILGSGVSVANHKRNPQVWFEHGEDDLYTLTLALSEDEEGNYTVAKPDDFTIVGVSHFAKPASKFQIVNQLFAMIDLGVIRAVSIHVQPNPGGLSTYTDRETGAKYQVTEDSHLIEYSHCKVGVNPEALKKSLRGDSKYNPMVSPELIRAVELQANAASRVINSKQINNELLLPSIKKSLKAMVRTGNSTTLKKGEAPMATKKKTMTSRELVSCSNEEIAKIVKSDELLNEYDAPSKARIKSMFRKVMEENSPSEDESTESAPDDKSKPEESGSDESKPTDTESSDSSDGEQEKSANEDEEENGDDTHHSDNMEPEETTEPNPEDEEESSNEEAKKKNVDDKPLGQSVMAEAYDALKYLTEAIEKSMKPVEKPEVVEGMGEILSQMKGMADAMDGVHTKAYGNPFAGKNEENSEEEEQDETAKSQLKSFLSSRGNQVETFRLIGLVNQARRLSEVKGVSEGTRKSLSYVASGFEEILSRSEKSRSESITRSQYDAVVKERDEAIAARKKAISQRDALIEKTEKLMKEALPAS